MKNPVVYIGPSLGGREVLRSVIAAHLDIPSGHVLFVECGLHEIEHGVRRARRALGDVDVLTWRDLRGALTEEAK